MPLSPIIPFLKFWRTSIALDREVVDAVVRDGCNRDQLNDALELWPGTHYWSTAEGPDRLVLIRALAPAPREWWWLHIALFVSTFITVWMGGVLFVGSNGPAMAAADATMWVRMLDWLAGSGPGLGFAVSLVGLLLAHEMGHYVLAARYHINASPPFFLPAPPVIAGTLGAFIRLRSPIVDRQQLFDVGAAGPWAGAVISIGVLVIGLMKSQVFPEMVGVSNQFVSIHNMQFYLGDSLLMAGLKSLVVGPGTVALHPLAVAGWCGLFVTMLNLFPLGQLDGGHVLFALVGKHQRWIGWLSLVGLGFLGFYYGRYWWLWGGLILLLGRGQLAHPSVVEPHRPVPKSRWVLGILTILLFVVTFSPDPLPSSGGVVSWVH